jgi:hypothetical protein
MTELTKQLTKQLILHQNDTVIKDLKADQWFTGRQVSADVTRLRQHFINLKLTKGRFGARVS